MSGNEITMGKWSLLLDELRKATRACYDAEIAVREFDRRFRTDESMRTDANREVRASLKANAKHRGTEEIVCRARCEGFVAGIALFAPWLQERAL